MKNKSKPPIKLTETLFQTTEIDKSLSRTSTETSPKNQKPIKKWSHSEDQILLEKAKIYKEKNWTQVSAFLPGRTPIQCSARYLRIKPGIKKGQWTKEEDDLLIQYVEQYGTKWTEISKKMKNRTGKQIRDRYLNSLQPSINKSHFTEEEDKKILELYAKYGKAWSGIACELPGRTADMVKNRFYCTLKYYIKKENILLGKKRKEDGKVKFEVRNCTITNNQSNINSNNQQDNFSVCQNVQIMFSPFITCNNFDNSRYITIPQGTYLNNTTIVLLDSYNQSKIKNSSIKESYSFLSDNMNFQEEIKQKDEVALGNVYIKGGDVKKKIDISSNLDALKALIQREQDKTCVAMQLKLLNEIKTQIEIKESCFN